MRWFVLLTAACGRIDFDETGGDGGADLGSLTKGCALWLRMDEPTWTLAPDSVRDSCGNGHHGTLDVAATTIVDPVRGTVGNFAGTQCIDIPDAPDLHPTTALTLSAWVRPTTLGSSDANGIVAKRLDIDTEHSYGLFIWTGDLAYLDVDDMESRLAGTTTLTVDQWQLVTAVYDGNAPMAQRNRIYIADTLDAVGPEVSASIPPYTAPITVGCQPGGGPSEWFTGQLDEVIVWHRALSAAEVGEWYAATRR